jgi:hypothetical protein
MHDRLIGVCSIYAPNASSNMCSFGIGWCLPSKIQNGLSEEILIWSSDSGIGMAVQAIYLRYGEAGLVSLQGNALDV